MRSFGYELSGKYSDRGRYMEDLGFHVATVWGGGVASSVTSVPHASPCAFPPLQGGDPWSYQWVGNFASPKATTYASDLLLTLEVGSHVVGVPQR